MKILEIIVLDVDDVLEAQAGGATSLEAIQNLAVGGLTPDFDTLKAIRAAARVHLNVIIRPHGRDFTYTPAELDQILRDAEQAVRLGADGIVFGALNREDEVDVEAFRRVVHVCRNLNPSIKMTFHRAIEQVRTPETAFHQLKGLADRILCSGLDSAMSGNDSRDLLRKWIKQYGGDFQFACGGGVNLANLPQIIQRTGAPEYHVGSGARMSDSRATGAGTTGKVDRRKVEALVSIVKNNSSEGD